MGLQVSQGKVHIACADSCEHEVGWHYAGPAWWNLDVTLSSQGLSLLEVSPWDRERWGSGRQKSLSSVVAQVTTALSSQEHRIGNFCTSQACMHLPVSRVEVAFVSAICDFVTLGKSLHPSELKISSVNQAAILNLPSMDRLEFELILIWELCSGIARIEQMGICIFLHFFLNYP